MSTYFLRRILLMIPTFIGITFVCYSIMRFVPGGPVEQAIMKLQMGELPMPVLKLVLELTQKQKSVKR